MNHAHPVENPLSPGGGHHGAQPYWRATELVLDAIENPDGGAAVRGCRVVIEPELIVRESTGPANPRQRS